MHKSTIDTRTKKQSKEVVVLEDSLSLQPAEREVIMQRYKFPKKLQEAADAYSTAIIAQYVFELARTYNRTYEYVSIFRFMQRATP